jgi:protein phosphatase
MKCRKRSGTMQVTARTDAGLIRTENQDRVMFTRLGEDAAAVVVCDGMGGENGGGEASELAVNVIFERLLSGYRSDADSNSLRNLLITSINAANSVVYEKSLGDENKFGMGTTCVCGIFRRDIACIASVGDSRAYAFDGEVRQITNDHTIVRMLVERGELREAEVENHPQRNVITRAVGIDDRVDSDYYEIDIKPDTVILMCTDGLSGYCSEEKLKELIMNKSLNEAAESLIAYAIAQGGKDNITVALVSDKNIQE